MLIYSFSSYVSQMLKFQEYLQSADLNESIHPEIPQHKIFQKNYKPLHHNFIQSTEILYTGQRLLSEFLSWVLSLSANSEYGMGYFLRLRPKISLCF